MTRFYLVVRIQKARDDGTTIAEWSTPYRKGEPNIDRVIDQAKSHGFEVRPNFGHYDPSLYPLTAVFYVGQKMRGGNPFGGEFGRNSTIYSWPCRKV